MPISEHLQPTLWDSVLTSLPEGSPVRASVSPGSEEARMTTVGSGRKWLALLTNAGPAGCLVKTLMGSSTWHSTIVSLIWKASVTKRGRLYFRLVASERGIDAIASGLLPTPVANESGATPEAHLAMKRAMPGGPRNTITSLQVYAKAGLLPTPVSHDAGAHRGNPDSLHSLMKLLPTPRHANPSSRPNGMGGKVLAEEIQIQQGIRKRGQYVDSPMVGQLNPEFVEWMMGYPIGHTEV